MDTPSEHLYSARQVALAAFLGSPVAGGLLLARNDRTFGNPSRAWKTIALTALFSLLLIPVTFVVPDRFPSWPIPLVYTVILYQLADALQTPRVNERTQRGAALFSSWRVIGIGRGS